MAHHTQDIPTHCKAPIQAHAERHVDRSRIHLYPRVKGSGGAQALPIRRRRVDRSRIPAKASRSAHWQALRSRRCAHRPHALISNTAKGSRATQALRTEWLGDRRAHIHSAKGPRGAEPSRTWPRARAHRSYVSRPYVSGAKGPRGSQAYPTERPRIRAPTSATRSTGAQFNYTAWALRSRLSRIFAWRTVHRAHHVRTLLVISTEKYN